MKLRDYLKESGISITAFSRKCKLTPCTMHHILNGRDIKLTTAYRIEKASKGEVTMHDLIPIEGEKVSSKKITTH